MKTLPLILEEDGYWDLRLSKVKNLDAIDSATNEPEYCAQTVANACRLFQDDAYFFPDEGIPYFEEILGQKPPASLVYAYLREAAAGVPLVASITVENFDRVERRITGTLRLTTANGSTINVRI